MGSCQGLERCQGNWQGADPVEFGDQQKEFGFCSKEGVTGKISAVMGADLPVHSINPVGFWRHSLPQIRQHSW